MELAFSAIALAVSIGSLIWTILAQREQNARWDATNLGDLELSSVRFKTWYRISKEEAESVEWGHDPLLLIDSEASPDRAVSMPYELILTRPSTGQPLPGLNGAMTLDEAQAMLEALGDRSGTDTVAVERHFQVHFVFENGGMTAISNVRIVIKLKQPNSERWGIAHRSKTAMTLHAGAEINAVVDFFVNAAINVPDELEWLILVEYRDYRGERVTKEIPLCYQVDGNHWRFSR